MIKEQYSDLWLTCGVLLRVLRESEQILTVLNRKILSCERHKIQRSKIARTVHNNYYYIIAQSGSLNGQVRENKWIFYESSCENARFFFLSDHWWDPALIIL